MSDRLLRFMMLVAPLSVLSLASIVAAGQAPSAPADCPIEHAAEFHRCAMDKMRTFVPPRTPDGKPDLQGYWSRTVNSLDIQEVLKPRTGDPAAGVAKSSLIVDPPDGKIPYQPWAAAQRQVNLDKYIDPFVGCTVPGGPRASYISQESQVIQTPEYVLFMHERVHQYRMIPTDGRPHLGESIRLWGGDLRGRWEGNTLVVDVRNQNGMTWIDSAGDFYTDEVRVVERFTLIDPNTMHFEATVEDTHVFTKPFKIVVAIKRNQNPGFELMEDACVEGERDYEHFLKVGYVPFPGVKGKR